VSRPRTAAEQEIIDQHYAARQAQRDKEYRQTLVERRTELVAEIEDIDKELASQEPVSIAKSIMS